MTIIVLVKFIEKSASLASAEIIGANVVVQIGQAEKNHGAGGALLAGLAFLRYMLQSVVPEGVLARS